MADEIYFYDWLRPVKHYKSMYDAGNDPWGSEGGTYDYPVVTRDDTNVYFLYRDGTGRPWIEIYPPGGGVKYLTSDDFDNPSKWGVPGFGGDRLVMHWEGDGGLIQGAWRPNEEGEEPLGRVPSAVEETRPLEETTPLFGPGDQTPDPPDDPTLRPGHWDPVSLRWVPDEPTSSVGKVIGRDHMGSRGESRPAADQDSSVADLKADLGDEEVAAPLRSGRWDPVGLRWVPDEPTSSVGRILDDDNSEDAQIPGGGGGAGGGVDPSVPFDRDTAPTGAEGTAAPPGINVDSIDFGGITARGVDRSGPLDQARQDRLGQQVEQAAQEPPPFDLTPSPDDLRSPSERPLQPFPPADPAVPFDPDTTPTSVEGTASTRVEVDPTSSPAAEGGGGSTAGIGVPYQDYIPFYPMVQDPATGEWRNAEPGEIPGVEEAAPAPGDDVAGIPGLGVPYQDFIPFFPMVQDSTTGEWRNAEPDEIPGPEGSEPNALGSPQMLSNLFDPNAAGPTLDTDLFNPNTPGVTLDPRLLLDSTFDPAVLDPSAPGPTLDPVQLEQGIVQPSSVAEPLASVTDQGFTDLGLTEEPAHPEPSTPGHHDHHDDPLHLG